MKKILSIIFGIALFVPSLVSAQSALWQGGTGWNTSTAGELLVGTSSVLRYTRLPIGTNGYVLQSNGTTPVWVATSTLGITGGGGGSGTVTSVGMTVPTGLSISGSPITTSGTLALTLTSNYTIPTTTLMTSLNAFLNTPSTVITAGNHIDWSSNTLNVVTTGDWTGTFDGQQGTYYLDRANHTGTQLAATISDFSSTARGLLSSTATGLTYTSGTGVFSLTGGYTIPTTTLMTSLNAFLDTPSTVITAGTGIDWSGNTLNVTATGSGTVGTSSAETAGYLPFWTTTAQDTALLNGTSSVFQLGNNVGIGTTSPQMRLHVLGDVRIDNATTSATSSAFKVDSVGHIIVQGPNPSVSDCGTSPSFIGGNDTAGRVMVGTGSPTACTITFANVWANPPVCIADVEGGVLTDISGSSTVSQLLFTAAGNIQNNVLTYQCKGY